MSGCTTACTERSEVMNEKSGQVGNLSYILERLA